MSMAAPIKDFAEIPPEAPIRPEPLHREASPAEPFPMEALGPLRDAAEAVAQLTQAPAALCAQSVLAAATLAVQAHADIVLPTGQSRPLSGFFVTVGESGSRKTSADHYATRAIKALEEELHAGHEAAMLRYKNDMDTWKRRRDKILSSKSKASDMEIKADLAALGKEPAGPLYPIHLVPEPTIQGLHRMMTCAMPSLGIFSAEGGQFLAGYGMSAENKIATAGALSDLWDGAPVKRVRGGDGVSFLIGRRVSMHLAVQPGIAARFMVDPELQDQGLLSRILIVRPPSLAGTRKWREPDPAAQTTLSIFQGRIRAIMQTPPPFREDAENELKPRHLPLSEDARRIAIAFYDVIERQVGKGDALNPIAPFAAKAQEHACRLAAVLAMFADLETEEVSEPDMIRSTDLVQHYIAEALRFAADGTADRELNAAQALLDWLNSKWTGEPCISLVEIYRLGPPQFRKKADAQRAVNTLMDHGHLAMMPDGATIKGTFRQTAWRITR